MLSPRMPGVSGASATTRLDELFRFRFGGTVRLWGFVLDHVIYVLWWDVKHAVYPTER